MGDEERWTLKETQFSEILEPFRRLSWLKSGMARILSRMSYYTGCPYGKS
jgi:hypothetical protein